MYSRLVVCSVRSTDCNCTKSEKINHLTACEIMQHHSRCPPCCQPNYAYCKYPVYPICDQSSNNSTNFINELIAKLYRAKQRYMNSCKTRCLHKHRKRLISCQPSYCGTRCPNELMRRTCYCSNKKYCRNYSRRVQTSCESCKVEILCNTKPCQFTKSTSFTPSCKTLAQIDSICNDFKYCHKPTIKALKCTKKCSKESSPNRCVTPPIVCKKPTVPCIPFISCIPNNCPSRCRTSASSHSPKTTSISSRKCSCQELGVQAFQSTCNCKQKNGLTNKSNNGNVITKGQKYGNTSTSNDNIITGSQKYDSTSASNNGNIITKRRNNGDTLTSNNYNSITRNICYYSQLLSKPRMAVPIVVTMFYLIFRSVNNAVFVY